MHSYRKLDAGSGWYVYFQQADDFTPVGPTFGVECEAAAYASFLNGGRYNPYEIEAVFAVKTEPDDDDEAIHPDRPKAFDNDYPLEATQRHK